MSILDLIHTIPIPIVALDHTGRSIIENASFKEAMRSVSSSLSRWEDAEEKIFLSERGTVSLHELAEDASKSSPLSVSIKADDRQRYRVNSTLIETGRGKRCSVLVFQREEGIHTLDRTGKEEDSHRTDDLTLLYEISRFMSSSQSLEDFIRFILDAVSKVSKGDCSLLCIAFDGAPTIFFSLSRSVSEEELGSLKARALSAFNETASKDFHDAQIIVYKSTDYLNDMRLTAAPTVSHWMPLFRKSLPVGVIGICPSGRRPISESNLRLLTTISNQASATLDRFLSSREAERSRFRSVVNSMTDGIVVTDLSGQVLITNPAAERIISQLKLRRVKEFGKSLGSKELLKGISAVKKGDTSFFSQEIPFNRHQMILNVIISPMLDMKENRTGIVFVLSDITKQRQLQEQIIQTEKLSALGELISGVSHELNNPLASVIGYAQLLQSTPVSTEMKKKLDIIYGESKRCQRIVQDLLTFARKHAYEKKKMDIWSAIDSVIQLLAYQFKVNSIILERRQSKEPPYIIGDFHQIQQVFLNLLNNALQALLEVRRKRTIVIKTDVADGKVIIEVRDNGSGIRKEHLGKVFDPFFTTKELGSGTGLGLSIARSTIKEHGGDIEVSSMCGKGTTFVVKIPALRAADSHVQRTKQLESSSIGSMGKKILVVDDEKKIYHIIQEALERDGHMIGYACDGETALEALKQDAFDMIISDFKMPEMDGKELFIRVNRKYPHLKEKFIFITGDIANPATSRFLKKRKAKFLTKPFDLDDIRKVISETFQRS